MIRGRVSQLGQALVAIDIMDSEGQIQPVDVVLDAGFTGYSTLPPNSIRSLDLPFAGYRTFELANGESFEFSNYHAMVSWHGRLSDVLVVESDSVPLVGMDLIWNSRVRMEAWADGSGWSASLPSASGSTPEARLG